MFDWTLSQTISSLIKLPKKIMKQEQLILDQRRFRRMTNYQPTNVALPVMQRPKSSRERVKGAIKIRFIKLIYSYKADVFSLGAVFFNLVSGRYLFSGKDLQELLKRNIECQTHTIKQFLSNNSPQCRDLMFWMIEAEPENRPTAKQALKHPWFTNDKHIIKELLAVNTLICSKSPDYRALSLKNTINLDLTMPQMMDSFTLGNNFLHRGAGTLNLGIALVQQLQLNSNTANNIGENKYIPIEQQNSIQGRSGQLAINRVNTNAAPAGAMLMTQFGQSSLLQHQNSSALQLFIAQQHLNYKQHESQVRAQLRRDATLNVPLTGKSMAALKQQIQPSRKNSSRDNLPNHYCASHEQSFSQNSFRVSYFHAIRNSKSNQRSSHSSLEKAIQHINSKKDSNVLNALANVKLSF